MSTTPPHPEASPDRPGAVTVSRIVARNSGHPEPYTGTRTVLVCSSRPRGSGATAAGGTSPRTPPLRWRGPQGTRNTPDNFGSAAGGFTQAPGGRAGPKLEHVEFPAFGAPHGFGATTYQQHRTHPASTPGAPECALLQLQISIDVLWHTPYSAGTLRQLAVVGHGAATMQRVRSGHASTLQSPKLDAVGGP